MTFLRSEIRAAKNTWQVSYPVNISVHRVNRQKFIDKKIRDLRLQMMNAYSVLRCHNSLEKSNEVISLGLYCEYQKVLLCFGRERDIVNFKKIQAILPLDEYKTWTTDTNRGRYLLDIHEIIEDNSEYSYSIYSCRYFDRESYKAQDGFLAINANSNTFFIATEKKYAQGFLKRRVKKKFAILTRKTTIK